MAIKYTTCNSSAGGHRVNIHYKSAVRVNHIGQIVATDSTTISDISKVLIQKAPGIKQQTILHGLHAKLDMTCMGSYSNALWPCCSGRMKAERGALLTNLGKTKSLLFFRRSNHNYNFVFNDDKVTE